MGTFHLSWLAFFVCFLGWFAHAPLLHSTIGPDLGLTRSQKLTAFMCSVGVTIFARVLVGWMCDRIGPRKCYVGLLLFGAFAVGASALAYDWRSYLLTRAMIGVIGASFVITQYHTSMVFQPRVVGLANATSAGWGNLGGGVTQILMPLAAGALVTLGLASDADKWRLAMTVPAVAMVIVAGLYWRYTLDPSDMAPDDEADEGEKASDLGQLVDVLTDTRVWILFLVYAGCFGLELFLNSRASTYYQTRFSLSETSAGLFAGMFGLMNLFARSLGGWVGDRWGKRLGAAGRVRTMVWLTTLEGLALILFSLMGELSLAVSTMVLFSLTVQMAEGAVFSVVPFVRRRSLGLVAGIVGAGGNVGAVMYSQVLLLSALPLEDCLFFIGFFVVGVGALGTRIHFSPPSARTTGPVAPLPA